VWNESPQETKSRQLDETEERRTLEEAMGESCGAMIVLGSEEHDPTSFRLEGQGEAYLPLIECVARQMPVTVRFWRGSSAEDELLRRFGLREGDISGTERVGILEIRAH
jgi:hypothetical protein